MQTLTATSNQAGTSITLSWAAPSDNGGVSITGYKVEHSTDDSAYTSLAASQTQLSYTHASRTVGSKHYYKISAINSFDTGSAKKVNVTTNSAPSAPTSLDADSSDDGTSIKLTWTDPTLATGQLAIAGYDVQFKQGATAPSSWAAFDSATNGITCSASGCSHSSLTNAKKYWYRVRVRNGLNGAWSANFSETTNSAPAAPTGLTANSTSNGLSMRIRWSQVTAATGQKAITGYTLQYASGNTQPSDDDDWSDFDEGWACEDLDETHTNCAHAGLTANTKYWYRLRAENGLSGAWSTVISKSTNNIPGKVVVTAASAANGLSINLSWPEPDTGGSAITAYKVESAPDSSGNPGTWSTEQDFSANKTGRTYAHTVALGSTHYYRVTAKNNVDSGTTSDVVKATSNNVPAAPTVTVARGESEELDVSWAEPEDNGSSISDYDVQYRKGSTGDWTAVSDSSVDEDDSSYTIEDLDNGDEYEVQVRAVNAAGDGAWSATAKGTPATTPDAPTSLTFTAAATQLTLSWTAPSEDGGDDLTGYSVEYVESTSSTTPTTGWASVPSTSSTTTCDTADDVTTTSCIHAGLDKNTKYWYRIKATNDVGDSSGLTNSQTTNSTVPGDPDNLSATVSGLTVSISWDEPDDDGGLDLEYTVQFAHIDINDTPKTEPSPWPTLADSNTVDCDTDDNTTKATDSTSCSVTLSTDDKGDTYWYQVKATNTQGDSGWSDADDVTVPETVPGAPTSVSPTVSGTDVTISWVAPVDKGGGLTGYKVQKYEGTTKPSSWPAYSASTNGACTGNATATSCDHAAGNTGKGKTYFYRVFATNATGDSEGGTHNTGALIQKTKPDAPTLTSTAGDGEITLTWTAPTDTGGATISSYTVQYKETKKEAGSTIDANWTTLSSCTASGCSHSGLRKGDKYRYQVKANNGVTSGDDNWATQTTDTTVDADVPAKVASLTVTPSYISVGLSWTAPNNKGSAITGYSLQYKQAATAPTQDNLWETAPTGCASLGASKTSCTHSGLSKNKKYWYRLRATNAEGDGSFSDAISATTKSTVPGSVSSLAATSSGAGTSVALSWQAPSDDGGLTITGYKIEYSSDSVNYSTAVASQTELSYTRSSVGTGTPHYFKVSAINSKGTGSASSSNVTTNSKPGRPTSPSATSSGAGTSITLTWTDPALTTGKLPITGYNVQFYKGGSAPDSGGGSWAGFNSSTNGVTCTASGCVHGSDTQSSQYLDKGTTYWYRVQAKNGIDGDWSNSFSATTNSAPASPAGLAASSAANGLGMSISWTASTASTGQAAITGYTLQYAQSTDEPDDDDDWSDFSGSDDCASLGSTDTSCSQSSLTLGTKYWYRLRASNGLDGAWASTSQTTNNVPAAPTVTSSSAANGLSINLSWAAPSNGGASITGYKIEHAPDSSGNPGTWSTVVNSQAGRTYAHTVSAGSVNHYRVSAINSVGTGSASAVAKATANNVPSAPAAPTVALGDASGELDVSWSAPDSNGSSISDYDVQYRKGSSGDWTAVADNKVGSSDSSHTLTGLDNGDEYEVQVRAVNAVGDGSWSAAGKGTPATTPDAPTSLTFTAAAQQNTVSWTAPTDNGGNDISEYELEFVQSSDATAPSTGWAAAATDSTSTCDDTITGTSCVHAGLSKFTNYWYRVKAVNDAGKSGWSTAVAQKTLSTGPGNPGTPTTSVSGTTATVSWTAPDDGGLTLTYALQSLHQTAAPTDKNETTYSNKPGENFTKWATVDCHSDSDKTATSSTSCDHPRASLVADEDYWYRVRAINDHGGTGKGLSSWVATTSKTTISKNVPEAPTGITTSVSGTTVTLSWTAPTELNTATISGYQVQYHEGGNTAPASWASYSESANGACKTTSSSTVTCDHVAGNAGKGKKYWYRLWATSNNGNGLAAVTGSVVSISKTKPGAPTGLTSLAGNGIITLSWTAPADTGGATITGYTVQYKKTPDGGSIDNNWTALSSCTASGCKHTSLTKDDEYRYRVRANNGVSAGTDNWITQSSDTTVNGAAPDAPTALTLTAQASGTQIDLSWTAPANNNGSAITDYDVEMVKSTSGTKPSAGFADVSSGTCANVSTTTSCAVTSLDKNAQYWFQVFAKNTQGTETTGIADKQTTATTKPGTVQSLTVTSNRAGTTLTLSWTAPDDDGGADISGYKIEHSTDGSSFTPEVASQSALTYADTSLTAGSSHYYKVYAINSQGNSAASASGKIVTNNAMDAPTSLSTSTPTNGTEIELSWTDPTQNTGELAITGYDVQFATGSSAPTWATFNSSTNGVSCTASPCTHSNLNKGTTYWYRVRVKNGLNGAWSNNTSETTNSAPSAPTGLSASSASDGLSMSLSWTASTASTGQKAITGYSLQYAQKSTKPNNDAGWSNFSGSDDCASLGSSDTSCTHSSLTSDTKYWYRLRTSNGLNSTWSTAISKTTHDVPGAPTVTASSAANGLSINLSWAAPSNGGSSITGYKIEHADDSSGNPGMWSQLVASQTARTYAHTVSAGSVNHYRVSAKNDVGTGSVSTAVKATANNVPSQMSVPTVAMGDASGELDVSWSAPDNNGASISDYDVQYRKGSTGDFTAVADASIGSSDSSYTITGLDNGDEYEVQVRAVNAVGDGSWSDSGKGTPATTPGAPTTLTFTAAATQLTISWTAPTDDGGDDISEYELEYYQGASAPASDSNDWVSPASDNTSTCDDTVTGTSCIHASLSKYKKYHYRVKAKNDAGDGAWSTSSSESTLSTGPGNPGTPTTSVSGATVSVSWIAPDDGGLTLSYELQSLKQTETPDEKNEPGYSKVGETPKPKWTAVSGCTASSTSCDHILASLTQDEDYWYRVRAKNSHGGGSGSLSSWVAIGSKTTVSQNVPAAPTNLATSVSDTTVTVSWTAPTTLNGATINGYEVQYHEGGNSAPQSWAAYSSSTNGACTTSNSSTVTCDHDADNAGKGKKYWYRAWATSNNGNGIAAVTSTAASISTTVPAAPTLSTPTAGNGKVSLSWTAPTDTGGASIASYKAQYAKKTSGTFGSWTDVSGCTAETGTSCEHTGLTKDDIYKYKVQAKNSVGGGAWSTESGEITVNGAAPDAPTGLTLSAQTNGTQINLSWTAPANNNGSAITDYDVEMVKSASGTKPTTGFADVPSSTNHTCDDTGTGTSCTVTGLDKNTQYWFVVFAVNGEGTETTGIANKATTATTAPDEVQSFTITSNATGTSLTLSWTAPADDGGSDISGYKIEHSTDGSTYTSRVASQSGLTYTHTGLTAGSSNYYKVYAINAANLESNGSTSGKVVTNNAMEAPTSLSASSATNGTEIELSWSDPSRNAGELAITGYDVQYATGSSAPTWATFNSSTNGVSCTASPCTHSSLTKGTKHWYRVRVTNGVVGAWSANASATTNSAPAAPTGLAASSASDGLSMSLSWTASTAATGQKAITGYTLQYAKNDTEPANDAGWTSFSGSDDCASLDDTDTSCTHSSLTSDSTYWYRLRANNGLSGTWSTALSQDTHDEPAQVTGLQGSSAANGTAINLSWSAPSNGGSSITGYKIEHAPDSSGSPGTWSTAVASHSSRNYAHSVSAGSVNHYRVSAINDVGTGSASAIVKSTANNVPDAPAAPTVAMGDASGELDVDWSSPASNGATISDFDMQYRKKGASTWTAVSDASIGSSDSSHTLTSLDNGDEYEVQVRAVNAVGDGSWSATGKGTPATVPGAPSLGTLTAAATQNTINWSAPSSDGGDDISEYELEFYQGANAPASDSADWGDPATDSTSTCDDTVTGTSCIHASLSKNKKYHYRVRAKNDAGYSTWSTTKAATTLTTAPGTPGTPTTSVSGATVTISWMASDDGGLSVTYELERVEQSATPDNSTTWTAVSGCTASSNSCEDTFSTLNADKDVWYRVQAKNSHGGGSGSTSSWAATTSKTTIRQNVPSAPQTLSTSVAGTTVTISWTAPANNNSATIDGYEVQFYEGTSAPSTWPSYSSSTNGACTTSNASTRTCDHVAGNAGKGKSYWYRVWATSDNGNGIAAATNTAASISTTKPATPTGLTSTAGNGVITLSWTAPTDTGGAAITGYTVQYKKTPKNGSIGSWTALSSCTASGCKHESLTKDDKYRYQVKANNGVTSGNDNWVTQGADTTVNGAKPDAPTGLTFVADANGTKLTLSWTAPNNNGSAITDYDVEMVKSTSNTKPTTGFADVPSSTNHTCDDTGPEVSCTVTGLDKNTQYWFQVEAINGEGTSTSVADKQSTEATAPSVPQSLAAASSDDGTTVNLSWSVPSDKGGYSAVTYKVEGSETSGSGYTTLAASQSTLTYAHTGRSTGTAYYYKVSAVNGKATGTAATVNTTTNSGLSAPGSLTATTSGDGQSIALSWTAPTAGTNQKALSGYDLWFKQAQNAPTEDSNWETNPAGCETLTAASTSCTHTSLSTGKPYHYRLRAKNGINGAWATDSETTTGVPGSVTLDTNYTSDSSAIKLSWTAPDNGGQAITGYEVQFKQSASDTVTWEAYSSANAVSCTASPCTHTIPVHARLVYGQYHYRARAKNSAGTGAWGADVKIQLRGRTTVMSPLSSGGVDRSGRNCVVVNGMGPQSDTTNDTRIQCWGDNTSGSLGHGQTDSSVPETKDPVYVRETHTNQKPLKEVVAVATGNSSNCALLKNGKVKCWGTNTSGQLGNNSTLQSYYPVFVKATSSTDLTGVTAIASGEHHTCALMEDTTVKCWGYGDGGVLGNGQDNNQTLPVDVEASAGTNLSGVVSIAAARDVTCAVMNTGKVKCWGLRNGDGVTGGTNRPADLDVTGKFFGHVESFRAHACASTLIDGEAYCWGNGGARRLGNGDDNTDKISPVKVLVEGDDPSTAAVETSYPLKNVVELAPGGPWGCARTSSGGVSCWGSGGRQAYGHNAGGDYAATSYASQNNAMNAKWISVGLAHACAVYADDDTVYCWGREGEWLGNDAAGDNLDWVNYPVRAGSLDLTQPSGTDAQNIYHHPASYYCHVSGKCHRLHPKVVMSGTKAAPVATISDLHAADEVEVYSDSNCSEANVISKSDATKEVASGSTSVAVNLNAFSGATGTVYFTLTRSKHSYASTCWGPVHYSGFSTAPLQATTKPAAKPAPTPAPATKPVSVTKPLTPPSLEVKAPLSSKASSAAIAPLPLKGRELPVRRKMTEEG